jgi:hypothetical protein
MSKLKPIGSEKLTGTDKIKRILEIANYNNPQNSLKEGDSDYSINLVDGYQYHIVKEKQGYIIKKGINESAADYIEPMKNRKYYSSYGQALKRLNLIIKEVNVQNGNEEGTSLFGEQKKFVIKSKSAPVTEPMMDEPAPAPMTPPSVPEPELPAAPMADDEMGDMPPVDDVAPEGAIEMDAEMDIEEPEMGDEEEMVTFKSIQKLTGKLTQKMRALESQEGMTSEDIKYVINMVLSAADLTKLTEEDMEDIMDKFENVESDADMNSMGPDEMGMEDEMDVEADMEMPMAPEEPTESYKPTMGMKESKIDKVLSNYFEVSDSEIQYAKKLTEERSREKVVKVTKDYEKIENLSETIEQEMSAKKFLEENKFFNLVGKTNKKNLVFEFKNKLVKISQEGQVL